MDLLQLYNFESSLTCIEKENAYLGVSIDTNSLFY